ncbi:MAG: VOC family protein [Myxococcota bacterium]
MSTIVPYLTFRKDQASFRFLTEGLDFEVVTEQRGDDGSYIHVELKRGDAVVMGGHGDVVPTAAPGVYLVVDDVVKLHPKLLAMGAQEVFPPEQTAWGTWRSRVTDPDGHEWTIGTYQPGQSWE